MEKNNNFTALLQHAKVQFFTMIELLMVVTIIIILSSILLPVFSKVKHKSRAIQCTMNLKQSGLATVSYCNDYTFFPIIYGPIKKGEKTFSTYESFHVLLAEYLGYGNFSNDFSDWNAFSLYETPGEGWSSNSPHRPRGVWNCPAAETKYFEYASNINTYGRRITDLKYPSNIIILADGYRCFGGPMYENNYPAKAHTDASWYWLKLLATDTPGPHSSSKNLLHGDFHVGKIRDVELLNIDGYFGSRVAKYVVPSGECK